MKVLNLLVMTLGDWELFTITKSITPIFFAITWAHARMATALAYMQASYTRAIYQVCKYRNPWRNEGFWWSTVKKFKRFFGFIDLSKTW